MAIIAYILTVLLFLGPVVLAVLGWPVEGDLVSKTRLYPSFYLLIITLPIAYFMGKMPIKKCKPSIILLLFIVLWYLACKLVQHTFSNMVFFNSMALPSMYYIFWQLQENKGNRKWIRLLILAMFLINCFLAFYERYKMIHFFPFDLIRSDIDISVLNFRNSNVFRSSALLGHPLTNALITSIIMVYILISETKGLIKYVLWLIGFISLMCFNARAAILISAFVMVLYLLKPFLTKSSWTKRILAGIVLVGMALAVIFLFQEGLGGRLVENGSFDQDNSALARLNVYDIFKYYGLSTFLWGMRGDDVENIAMLVMGAAHIENWLILSFMSVGIVATVIVIIFFVPMFKMALEYYNLYSCILILLIVLGLSSTNNSLACGVPAIATFFTCCYAFKPTDKS